MSKHFFVSDLHLGFKITPLEQKNREMFEDFLEYVKKEGDSLWLLGDIFDFWFEWNHVVPKYWFGILCHLKDLVDSGVSVNFITGNHDFHIGSFLEQQVGLICRDSDCEVELEGHKFFLGHGDGYAAGDKGYRLLKKVIRNKISKALFKNLIPSDVGMWLAARTSGTSRQVMAKPVDQWRDEYFQFALNRFDEGIDYVLLGHIHYPERRVADKGVYLNCGDWMIHRSYGLFDGKELFLNYWKPDAADI